MSNSTKSKSAKAPSTASGPANPVQPLVLSGGYRMRAVTAQQAKPAARLVVPTLGVIRSASPQAAQAGARPLVLRKAAVFENGLPTRRKPEPVAAAPTPKRPDPVAGWLRAALAGKNPTAAQWAAFVKTDGSTQAKAYDKVKAAMGLSHLKMPKAVPIQSPASSQPTIKGKK